MFLFYGNIFLNTFIIEVKNPEIFIENALLPDEYLLASIILPITAEKTGSLIEVSVNDSFSTGIPTKAGSLRTSLVNSRSHFCFAPHPTSIAHSGSIPSFHTILSSSLTNISISSYLAVAIFERYALDASQSSVLLISLREICLSLFLSSHIDSSL